VDSISDPLLLRGCAIGLLVSGESRGTVQAILDRDPRNSLLMRWFEQNGWNHPETSSDFGAGTTDNA
jgi:hypothetical protein